MSEENLSTTIQEEGLSKSTNNKISFKFSKRHDSAKLENELKPTLVSKHAIKTYKLRWLILIVICLINTTNTINWICYSPIADFTGKFYNVDYTQVNFLSIVSMAIGVPASILSFVVIDYFGIRLSLNLAAWLNFGGTLLRVLSSIGGKSDFIHKDSKYAILLVGQIFISLGGPFAFLVTTKFAQSWFTESQRALANTVALSSATFGVLIGAVIPSLIVNSADNYADQMSVLNIITSAMSLTPAILAIFINRSTPPTPPSLSSNHDSDNSKNINNTDTKQQLTFPENFRIYFQQIRKLLKSMQFIFLLVSFSLGYGLFNTLATLLQQILCVRGYSDSDVGIFGGIMISSGIIGSLISGIIVDKTKRFEEVAKICFCISCLSNIFFSIIQDYTNDNGFIKYLIIIAFISIGFFGLPLLPVCMEMSVECVYPIPEATATGLLNIAGQLVGIIMILAYPKIAPKVPEDSYTYTNIQTCLNSNSTSNSSVSSLTVIDYKYTLYGQTIFFSIISILFTIFYKCPYLRIKTERERLTEQILNSARLPDVF